MKPRLTTALLTLGLVAAACAEPRTGPAPGEPTEPARAQEPAPAVEPAAEQPTAEAPATTEPQQPDVIPESEPVPAPDDVVQPEWVKKYTAILPFEIGAERGFAKARKAGKPTMIFYTASW